MKTYMKRYFIIILIRINLITYSNPTMAFVLLSKIYCCNRICIRKKQFIRIGFTINSLFDKINFVREHLSKPCFSNVSSIILDSINGIAEVFAVSRHGLRDGTRSTPNSKKITHCFLPGTNLGKTTVNVLVQIDS